MGLQKLLATLTRVTSMKTYPSTRSLFTHPLVSHTTDPHAPHITQPLVPMLVSKSDPQKNEKEGLGDWLEHSAKCIDGFHGTFYHGNWRAFHHHAACWLVNIHIMWLFCSPVSMVKDAMESICLKQLTQYTNKQTCTWRHKSQLVINNYMQISIV